MAKRPPKTKGPTPVEAIKHKDTRKNIPTEELRDFIADDEAKPKSMLYPRDPSLDPQLVWKGMRHESSVGNLGANSTDGCTVSLVYPLGLS